MRKIIFILLLFLTNLAFANQHPVLDNLAKEAKRISAQPPSFGRDTLLIFALWELTFYANYFKEKNTKFLLDSLERFSNRTNWQTGKGLYLFNKTNYILNFERGQSAKALENAFKTLEVLKGTSNLKALAYAHLKVSSIMLWFPTQPNDAKDKFLLEGLNHAKTMVELGKKIGDKSIICHSLAYEANHYLGMNRQKEALLALNEAEKYLQGQQLTYFAENLVYGTMAGLYSNLGNEPKTIEYIDKCLASGRAQNDNYCLSSMLQFKGELFAFYAKEKNVKKGIPFLEESYIYAKKLDDISVLSRIESLLYGAYKSVGNRPKALQYLELHKAHDDSLSRVKVQKTYADYELLQKETQIKTLENEKLQTEARRQILIRNTLIISILLGIGLVIYFFKNNQKLKNKNREIEQALYKGQTIERKRVATELHDNLSAKISGVKWRLEAIQPDFKIEKQRQIYESSVNALSEIYTDVRLISHNLLPIELETKGLAVAVENLVKELNSLEKTKFSLEISENMGRFDNKIEYELFSIILELSNNILKHSGATDALISLQKTDNQLQLLVKDNGKGFDTNKNNSGIGLKNLYSRIEALHGFLKIENTAGVQVKIEIPVVS